MCLSWLFRLSQSCPSYINMQFIWPISPPKLFSHALSERLQCDCYTLPPSELQSQSIHLCICRGSWMCIKWRVFNFDFVEVGEVEGRKIWQKGRLLSNNCVFISETLLTSSRGRGRSSTDASRQHTRTLQPQSHSGGQIHGCASHLSPLAEIFLIISQSNSWFKVSGWIDQMAQTWIWKLKNFSLSLMYWI